MRAHLISDEKQLKAGMNPVDVSIGQMLDLAKLAKIEFDVVEGRLVMFSSQMNWKLWKPLRRYLDEIGVQPAIDGSSRQDSSSSSCRRMG